MKTLGRAPKLRGIKNNERLVLAGDRPENEGFLGVFGCFGGVFWPERLLFAREQVFSDIVEDEHGVIDLLA